MPEVSPEVDATLIRPDDADTFWLSVVELNVTVAGIGYRSM
jgi:hypothetical protein